MIRVFISANQKELEEERFVIRDLINNHHTLNKIFTAFLFEGLPAKGNSPKENYLKEVKESDLYIGIIGCTYGQEDENGKSATEIEYQAFIENKGTENVLIFIKGEADKDKEIKTREFIKNTRDSYVYKRIDTTDTLKSEVLSSLICYLDEKGMLANRPFDEAICYDANYNDIDENEVTNFLRKRDINFKEKSLQVSIQDFLINIFKLVVEINGEYKPLNSCIVFFGKNPSDIFPQSIIKIARYRGSSRTEFVDSQELSGPIYPILDQIEVFFKRNTRLASKIIDFKRVDIPEYPFEAVREAVINALAHRDYSIREAQIIISIFDDRIEISSPGKLLPELDINNIEGHHATRNQKICSIFHETKDMEKFGTGISKMKFYMNKYGLPEPDFTEEGSFFVVRLFGPGEKILDNINDLPDVRTTDLIEIGLNERQIEALKLMLNKGMVLNNRIYREQFKVTNKTAATDLKDLVEKDLVFTKGKGRNVEYYVQ